MSSLQRFGRRALVALLVVLVAAPAWAEPVILQRGDPAPADGIFLSHADALRLGTVLKGTPLEQREAAILETLVTAQEKELAELKIALSACKATVQIQQQIDAAKDQMLGHYRAMVADYKSLLADARVQFGKDAETITRLEKRIESLETRSFWTVIVSLVIGLAASVFTGGLLR